MQAKRARKIRTYRWTMWRKALRSLLTQTDPAKGRPWTPAEVKEHLTKSVKQAAVRGGWRASEVAMTLADHYLELEEVMRRCNERLIFEASKGNHYPPVIDVEQHPLLCDHVVNGRLVWDKDELCYMGRASDGERVRVGSSDANQTETYLREHPTPETW